MEILLIYIVSVIIGCFIGNAKGRLSSGLIWSLLFGPLGIVIVIFLPKIVKQKQEGGTEARMKTTTGTLIAASGPVAQDSLAGIGHLLKRLFAEPQSEDSHYNQEQTPDGRIRFTVTPASVPKSPNAMGCGIVFAVFVAVSAACFVYAVLEATYGPSMQEQFRHPELIAQGPDKLTLFLMGISAVVAAVAAFKLISMGLNQTFASKVNKMRSPGGIFIVSRDRIEASNGEIISADRLHRLILRNGVPDVNEAMFVGTSYVANNLRNYQVASAAAKRAAAEKISYMLCAEHAGKSTCLAGGMTETTAYGLMRDVSSIMGLKG
jgi:hypothetical protein